MIFDNVLTFILWLTLTLVSIYTINFRNRCKKDLTSESMRQQSAYLNAVTAGIVMFSLYALLDRLNPEWVSNYFVFCAILLSVGVSTISLEFIKKCKDSTLTTNAMWIPGGSLVALVIIFILLMKSQLRNKKSLI